MMNIPDSRKVREGLKYCIGEDCRADCPYHSEEFCQERLLDEVEVLLKNNNSNIASCGTSTSTSLCYKNFEVRHLNGKGDNEYELVQWNADRSNYFVIAWLTYDVDEGVFDVGSVGTRLLEYGPSDLNKWLLKWCELAALTHQLQKEDDN